jgi:hypothetical protein
VEGRNDSLAYRSIQERLRKATQNLRVRFTLELAKHKACKSAHLYKRMREYTINIALIISKFPIGKDPEPVLSTFNAIYFILLPFSLLGLPMSIPSKNLYQFLVSPLKPHVLSIASKISLS